MSIEKCIIEASKALGRDLSKEEKKEITDTVSEIINRMKNSEDVGDLGGKVLKAIDDLSTEVKTQALIQKRNEALNQRAQLQLFDQVWNNFRDDPVEGLKSLLGDSLINRPNSKLGVAGHVNALQRYFIQGLVARIAERDLTAISSNRAFNEPIFLAMHELSQPKPNPEILSKFPKEAVELAQIFQESKEILRQRYNQAGGWIGKLDGHVVRQTHDYTKIKKAAGKAIKAGDPAHKEAWIQFISDRLDWDRTVPDLPQNQRYDWLSKQFEQLSNGDHVKFGEGGTVEGVGFGNIGKRQSHERVYHFKDAKSAYEYFNQFGQGGTVLDNLVTGLRRTARDTAIMERLGPNAEKNLDQTVSKYRQRINDSGEAGSGELAKKTADAWITLKDNVWRNINGETAIPVNQLGAQISQSLRDIFTLGDLGRVTIHSIPDVVSLGSIARASRDISQNNFFHGTFEGLKAFFTFGEITAEQQKLASAFGIGWDVMMPPMGVNGIDLTIPGTTSNWVREFFKFNLFTARQDRIRVASVLDSAHYHALHAGTSFQNLPKGLQSFLNQFGLREPHWDLIRSMEAFTDQKGRKLFSPEGILAMDPARFDSVIQKGPITEAKRIRARRELADNYRQLFSELASYATNEVGAIERGLLQQGTRPGTLKGEAFRFVGQYKGFMAAITRKQVLREIYGYGAGERLSSIVGLANLITFGALFGYAAQGLSDISKGLTPRIPTDSESFGKIFAASLVQSGSAGIYGDFLFGEMKSRFGQSPLETFLGPWSRRVSDLMDLWGRFKSGDDVGAKAFQFAVNNAPGVNGLNMFYTKWALDYLIMYRMHEIMNPGYLRRMERRLKKEKDQEYLVPPSSVIPYGGGF